jgi:hypothetical protein
MDRGAVGSSLVVLLCVLIGTALLAGCGSSGTARLENPVEFFMQTRENMQNAASFRVNGEMVMEFKGVPGMDAMAIDYDMVCEIEEGGELLARMVMSVEEPYGLEVEMYILEGRMYMEMPGGIWVYEDLDLASDLADMSQGMGPQYMMDMLEMAESAEVVAEDSDSITYRLVMDYNRMMADVDMEEMRKQLVERGMSEEYLAAFEGMMKEMISAMDIEVTADKDSGMISGYGFCLEMSLDAMAQFFEGGELPPGSSMVMDADFTVSDYGKPFDIRLPDEAKDAVPMEEL